MNYNYNKKQLQEVQIIFPGIEVDLAIGLLMKYQGDRDYQNLILEEVNKKYKGQYPKERDKAIKPSKPEKDFSGFDTRVSANYTNNARNFLFNCFRFVPSNTLNKVLSKHNSHLTPSINFLKKNMSRHPGIFAIKGLDGDDDKETIVDSLEAPRPLIPTSSDQYDAQFEEEIAVVKKNQKKEKIERVKSWNRSREYYDDETSGKGLIYCCACDNRFLEKETVACSEGHRACIECVVCSIQVGLKGGQAKNICIGDKDGKCNACYSDLILQHILNDIDYQRFTAYEQELALGQLKDDRLLRCNFCGYREYMPEDNEDFKLKDLLTFHCKNPDCMIVTCLKCQKPYHLPELCPQMKAEKGIGSLHQAVQVAVETVLIRHCPTCGLPTFKTQGCNHISCKNGCHWCYCCGKAFSRDTIYGHFGKPPTNCSQGENSPEEDKKRMRQRALQAVQDWKAQHPDMAHLTIDIEQYIPK